MGETSWERTSIMKVKDDCIQFWVLAVEVVRSDWILNLF